MTRFCDAKQCFTIAGTVGSLEAIIEMPKTDETHDIIFVMCHPSPLGGGSMDNKVVTTACRAMQELGVTTLRFNFRGVGQSAGSFDQGVGEVEDVKAVLAWVLTTYPTKEIWLGGFSFGAAMAYKVASTTAVAQLLSIAPAVVSFVTTGFAEPNMPWAVIQGDADEVVEPEAVYTWLAQHEVPYLLKKLPGIGHFFHGQLVMLRQLIKAIYQPRL